MRRGPRNLLALLLALGMVAGLTAQQGEPATPRAAAPVDLTGFWVSVVTEDWRWRMLTPQPGDYSSVPLNDAGRKVADVWTPASLETDGCRAYGAPAIMRVPGRLRIAWEDDTTLRIDTDAGQQVRRLRFDPWAHSGPGAPSRQGFSVAAWQIIRQPGGLGVSLQPGPSRPGALKVVTTNLLPGYLRRNGVPYSEQTMVTEYFDRLTESGTDWLVVLTIVDDPRYLNQPFITSTHFRREPDDAKWAPEPC